MGNIIVDVAGARVHYERAQVVAQALVDRFPNDPRCAEHLMPPIGNLARLTRISGEYTKALELENRFLELAEEARKRTPQSPPLLEKRGIGFDNKAHILVALNRPDEAMKCYRESIASYRSAAKENPLASRFQWLLADELRTWAAQLSSRRDYAQAKACYEESCEILDALTQRVDDRPMYGAALIESWESLAEFYQGTKGDTSNEVTQQQGRLRCLDQAVQIGRKLSKKFPTDVELHFQLAEILFQRAFYDSSAERNTEAYPFYQESVETFTSRVATADNKPTSYQLNRFLAWMDFAQQCAQKLKRDDEVTRLAKVADDVGKGAEDRMAVTCLGTLISRAATVHYNASRFKDASLAYSRAIQIRKPAFEKAPWHWYLRANSAGDYKSLAECYQKIGDPKGEVEAWRAYLTIWCAPMYGMKIGSYVDPARPADPPEAARVRQFAGSTPEMKRFNFTYDLNGVRYPNPVFITNVPWPKDPLEDQARYLEDLNGGTIPPEVRESFRKLHKIAYENNVSYIDLCVYAMNANIVSDAKKEEFNKTKKKLLADIVALTGEMKKEPARTASRAALAKAYQDLGAAQEGLGSVKEAIEALEQARQHYEELARQQPGAADPLAQLAGTQLKLGDLYKHYNVKDYVKSYTAYRRGSSSSSCFHPTPKPPRPQSQI